MNKKLIHRMLIGFPSGIGITQALTILYSFAVDGSHFYSTMPEFLSMINNEIYAAALQFVLSGLLGSICFASALIWEIDDWTLTKQMVLHFILICTSTLTVASILEWVNLTWEGLLLFVGTFIVIYLIIWFVNYQFYRIQISQINKKLNERKEDSECQEF